MNFFMGQIIMTGFTHAPAGFARCDGAMLAIHDYVALFELLGAAYGGDGTTTFALPNLLTNDKATGLHSYIALEGEYPSMG